MKEGATIKGLTTAASLWVVACLGLTIGSDAYAIAIIGFIAVILTLTVFEHASTFIPFGKYRRFSIKIQCGDLRQTLQYLNNVAKKYQCPFEWRHSRQVAWLHKPQSKRAYAFVSQQVDGCFLVPNQLIRQ